MLGDAEAGGEAGGADAGHGDPVPVGQRLDHIVLVLGGGAEPGIDGVDADARKRRHHLQRAGLQPFECRGIGRRHLALGHVLRRGADGEVAEGGAEQHDTLGALGGHRQDDGVHQPGGRLVEDHELAAPRRDGEGRGPRDRLHQVAEISGRIDHDARRDRRPPCCGASMRRPESSPPVTSALRRITAPWASAWWA